MVIRPAAFQVTIPSAPVPGTVYGGWVPVVDAGRGSD